MKLFKKTFSIYVILTILGMVCIGLGCGISVFELSNYKTVNYHSNQSAVDAPPIEMHTIELEAILQDPSKQFYLDATDWYFDGSYDIQYDNNLKDRVLIEVTAPVGLYNVYLSTSNHNEFYLVVDSDEFQMIRSALALAKEGYIPENYPLAKVKLTMSEAQAKNFKLNQLRSDRTALEQNYRKEINAVQSDYQQHISDLHDDHQRQMNDLNQQYSEQIQDLQQQYQDQLNQKDEQIENLRNQLNEAHNSHN